MTDNTGLQLLPRRDAHWKKMTCGEAQKFIDTCVVWWRPNMQMYSKDQPENDPAWVAEE